MDVEFGVGCCGEVMFTVMLGSSCCCGAYAGGVQLLQFFRGLLVPFYKTFIRFLIDTKIQFRIVSLA
jgi:hypothetical protein